MARMTEDEYDAWAKTQKPLTATERFMQLWLAHSLPTELTGMRQLLNEIADERFAGYQNAIRLLIGRQTGKPFADVSSQDVDSYVVAAKGGDG